MSCVSSSAELEVEVITLDVHTHFLASADTLQVIVYGVPLIKSLRSIEVMHV